MMRRLVEMVAFSFVLVSIAGCGGGGGGGGNGGTTCAAGTVKCGDACIDPLTSADHCGASGSCAGADAGDACGAGEACSAGECACQGTLVRCGESCVDTKSNHDHCGADASCAGGEQCGTDEVCSAGACVPTSSCTGVVCNGGCIDPNTSLLYCGASGDCAGANDGEACGGGESCTGGACGCPAGQVACGGTCIDPLTSDAFCGASLTGDCASDANNGEVCTGETSCSGGTCACPNGQVACGEAGNCIDPLTDNTYCGASGNCTGANDGATCDMAVLHQSCQAGRCHQEFDWSFDRDPTLPPFFKETSTTVAHILFRDGAMVELMPGAPTSWERIGTPDTTAVQMWSANGATADQAYSGPFQTSEYWSGTGSTKMTLDSLVGDFLVCVRFKPGENPIVQDPDHYPDKIILASGEALGQPGAGGWALMQRQHSYTFRYSTPAEVLAITGTLRSTLHVQEWSYYCAGRDGDSIRSIPEGADVGSVDGVGALQVGTMPSVTPTIGNYHAGTNPLFDGGVYEIIVTTDAATIGNARNLIAGAAGGLISYWAWNDYTPETAPRTTGFGGYQAIGSPATPELQGGYVTGDATYGFGHVLGQSPAMTGACIGMDAYAENWAMLPPSFPSEERILHTWLSGTDFVDFRLYFQSAEAPTQYCWFIRRGSGPGSEFDKCAQVAAPAPGWHKLTQCFAPDGFVRLYLDGSLVTGPTGGDVATNYWPALDAKAEEIDVLPSANLPGLRIGRVFACPTSDPSLCQ